MDKEEMRKLIFIKLSREYLDKLERGEIENLELVFKSRS